MRNVLLDTCAFSALFSGDDRVLNSISRARCVYVSAIAAGELMAGFRGGSRCRENMEMFEDFLSEPAVKFLSVTFETCDYFALIKDKLARHGSPIPTNDIWLGAHCLENGAVLITYDRHFENIPGLRIWPEKN